jgi:mRNA-degrading endonuclease YafQ of YafQ-DinJ toxin-antitoxin module
MLKAIYSGQFKREIKKAQKRGKDIEKIKRRISKLLGMPY